MDEKKVKEAGYVAPEIESVTVPEDLEREVLYAGNLVTHPPTP